MNSITLVVDRIENGIAVCEPLGQSEIIQFKTALLPKGAKEGDVLKYNGTRLILDKESTSERTKKIKGMLDTIFKV